MLLMFLSTFFFLTQVGDDLRKDILTLQMFRLMDCLWKEEGLDLHMHPYRVVATGVNSGIIEVVRNSKTVADIHKEYGGFTAAVRSSSLVSWLKAKNPSTYETVVVPNFMLSCAGCCVATYILGIGDRHNDNIMLTRSGNLFHIDFSRLMGDVMKFAGVYDRETTPFVLTPEFVEVMGGMKSETFKTFVSLCCKAYNIVRKHGNLLIALYSIMLETGIPRLNREKDLNYLTHALQVGQSEENANNHFKSLINISIENLRARLNFAIHILANPG